MLLTAILGVIIFLVARFLTERYWGGLGKNRAAAAAVGIYVLGLLAYPLLFRPSFRAVVPVATAPAPAAPAPNVPAAALPAPGEVACPKQPMLGTVRAPGAIDLAAVGTAALVTPPLIMHADNAAVIRLQGWIALASGPAKALCAIVDGHVAGAKIIYNQRRDDVAKATGIPEDAASGFSMTVPLRVATGGHTISLGAVAVDGRTVEPINVPAIELTTK